MIRVAWAYPASLVVPVAGLGVLMLAWPAGLGVGWAMLMGLAGLVGWTLIEYLLHRFVLHRVEPFRAWHVEHHRHATDPIRVPLSFSIALVLSMMVLPVLLLSARLEVVAVELAMSPLGVVVVPPEEVAERE